MRWPALLMLQFMLSLAACAPSVQEMGPAVQSPALTDEAYVAADGARLPLKHWPANPHTRAVVLALHGFNDYGNAFAAPAAWWAKHGIATYAIDQRGFGAAPQPGIWAAPETLVADARGALTALRARHPDTPVYLLGDSMGGAVSILALADGEAHADGLILAAPAVWGGKEMNPLFRAGIWFMAHTTPWNHATGGGLRRIPSDNIEMLRALGRDPLVIKRTRVDAVYGLTQLMGRAQAAAGGVSVPVLLLYGERDEIVPPGPVAAMAAKLDAPNRTIRYPEGYHMLLRDLQAETVWRDVAGWIAAQRASASATSPDTRR
ncbi:MAG: alpha/beta hydrolase [Alphaproteobacteria bacterium]